MSTQTTGVRIDGLADLYRKLDQLPQLVQTLGFLKALQSAADVIHPALQQNTPVGQVAAWNDETFSTVIVPSGSLKRSVTRTYELDRSGGGGRVFVHHGKLSFIANFLEYGHNIVTHWENKTPYKDSRGRTRYKKSGGHVVVGFVDPDPFIRDTADQVFDQVVEVMTESIAKTVDGGDILS